MKKTIITLSLLGGMLSMAFGTYYFSNKPSKSYEKLFDIAVMIPTSHSAIDQITAAFIKTVHARVPAQITVFNGNRNRALMKAQAEEALDRHCDLVLTVGAGTSLMMKESRARRNSAIPQLFTAVDDDPVKIGLVESLTIASNNITGVQIIQDHEKKIDMLLYLKPSIKRLLLIDDPTQGAGLKTDRDSIEAICKKRNVAFSELAVTSPHDICTRAATPIADAADAVLVLIDNTVVSALESLVALCNKHGILLYVSDLDSVDKGAALGFGIYESDSGLYAAQLALEILVDKRNPATIPIVELNEFYLKANPSAMLKQKLLPEPHVHFLLTHTLTTRARSSQASSL